MAKTASEALVEVKAQLQKAIELEHSTIPPYLFAFWSMKDHESVHAKTIYAVIKEEMLHMSLACNILNAIGGSPDIATPAFIPDYPTALPGHDMTHDPFVVGLQKCGIDAIITFLHIELPRELGLEPDEDPEVGTIGEFYGNIMDNLDLLSDEHFRYGSQVRNTYVPYKSGVLFDVNSKRKALTAINEILEQGEGLSLSHPNYHDGDNHYNAFLQMYRDMGGYGEIVPHQFNAEELKAKVDPVKYAEFEKGVRNIVAFPKVATGLSLAHFWANKLFNSAYSRMLDQLHEAMTSETPDMTDSIRSMMALTRPALEIMSIPIDPADLSKGYYGPNFQYIPKDQRI